MGIAAMIRRLRQQDALDAACEEILRLQAWKREQLRVESEWDAQAVGKELEIGWGESIRRNIFPSVLKLKESLHAAESEILRQGHRIVQQATAIELKDGIIGLQAEKIEFLEKTEVPRLEAEILRLRKNALTPPAEKVDNSIVQAKSTADVRRLTEIAFGLELREALNRQAK
jgi:hypothetical protein